MYIDSRLGTELSQMKVWLKMRTAEQEQNRKNVCITTQQTDAQ